MKASLGGGFLLNIVVVIVSIVILLFAGILAYSKAYRIKNRIVETIENNNGYNDIAAAILEEDLQTAGYTFVGVNNKKCEVGNKNEGGYNYCVYGPFDAENGEYYDVVTYIRFEFPVIGSSINIPVKGQTRILNKEYNY